jgi:hypothetical protein
VQLRTFWRHSRLPNALLSLKEEPHINAFLINFHLMNIAICYSRLRSRIKGEALFRLLIVNIRVFYLGNVKMPKPVTVYASIDILNQMYVDFGYRQVFCICLTILTFCLIAYYILQPSSSLCYETDDTPLIVVVFHNITSQYKSALRRTVNSFVTLYRLRQGSSINSYTPRGLSHKIMI